VISFHGKQIINMKKFLRDLLGPRQIEEVELARRALGRFSGVVVDVGAHHGLAISPFLKTGWIGFAIEPDPDNRSILEVNCPGLTIDSRAIAEIDGQTVSLFTSKVSSGISTLSAFHETHKVTATVETVRLDTFLHQYQVSKVDFLKIDIEGYDLFALRTFPWATHRPKVIVCEFEDKKTVPLGYDVISMAQFIKEKGYEVVVSEWEPIVEYGQQHTWKRFTKALETVNKESWGNLIAVLPNLTEDLDRECIRTLRRLRLRHWTDRIRGKV
jgi:FkbM family methyltransferase